MESNCEIIMETRRDLVEYLKKNEYEHVILKFYADWCAPCKHIGPKVKQLVQETSDRFQNDDKKFIFIEIDVDESFDLYAFLKSKKMVRGIPTMFLYSKSVYENVEENHLFIPQASVSGTNENQIRGFFNHIQ